MAVNPSKIRQLVPDGTLIRLDAVGREFVATRVDNGADITSFIPRTVRRRAHREGLGIRARHTKTGGIQWRKAELPEGTSATVVRTTATPTTATAATVSEHGVWEGYDEDTIRNLIDNALSLKPAQLLLSEVRWKYAIRSALRAKNLLFTGPAGCGKTMACRAVGQAFPDRPFFSFNLGASQDPRGMLIGNTHFSPDSGTFLSEALFIRAIQTPGAIIMMDEMSRAHDDAANILMTVLDPGQRYLRIDEAPDTPTIKVAPGVTFVSTANIGNEYTGARVMDRALLDRFTIIEMEPLGLEDEKWLLNHLYPNVDLKMIDAIAEIAVYTRDMVRSEDPKVSTVISTRVTVEMASLIDDGFSLAEVADVTIYPFFSEAGGMESERTHMKQKVQAHLPTELDESESPWDVAEDVAEDKLNKNPWGP